MRLNGELTRWRVSLENGSVVDIWAHAVTGLSGPADERDYEFGWLMDIQPESQHQSQVSARSAAAPSLVEILVARFPREAVADIHST